MYSITSKFTKSIAIVGNDPDLLNMYTEALKMSGYDDDVSSFSDPFLAYEHIKTSSKYKKWLEDEEGFNLTLINNINKV